MAAPLPVFSAFDSTTESWDDYLERFECFLQANDLSDLPSSRKRGYFLSSCGREVFGTARALTAPQPVFTVPWEVLLQKLRNHYAPAPSRIARRHAFYQRSQAEGENVNDYMASLRTAARHCEFPELDDALLDQLVCGVRDLKLQRRLLARSELTLAVAMDEARASEMSDKSAAEIRRGLPAVATLPKPLPVHREGTSLSDSADEDEDVSRLKAVKKKKGPPVSSKPSTSCLGCGGTHLRSDCRFKSAVCRRCGKRGHLSRVCKAACPVSFDSRDPDVKRRRLAGRRDDCFANETDAEFPAVAINHASSIAPASKLYITVKVEGSPCKMEIDTGSPKSLMAWRTLKNLVPNLSVQRLQPCPIRLKDYQGRLIPTLGCGSFRIAHGSFTGRLPLIVVRDNLPSLLGLDWFSALHLGVTGIHATRPDVASSLFSEFADVFDNSLGKYTGRPVSFNLDPQVAPIRLKPRRVPLALRPKVDQELDKLIRQGVLEPVDHSKWETPIVIPLKKDGTIRICADFKCTINRALQANPYPVPVVQQLLHSLGRGRIFAKLDLAQAYQQLPVDEETALAQTIVTHRGAFKCNRLQFGVSVAPGIFQSLMERLLHGLQGVVPYFDDILVAAADQDDLIVKMRAVLSRFRQAGLKLKRDKCRVGVSQVEFLGFLIDSQGIHPTPSKVAAIKNAPTPSSRSDLQAFLGLLNFYAMFLPHKASLAEPLHRLLDTKTPWQWNRKAAAAFAAVKDALTSDTVLVQYNESLPLSLTCDASPYGVGAVLSHILPNGSEAPIAYYSRTLSHAERNYSQLDREALAAVAGIKRFHDYVYGRFFLLVTDHKPLLGLLAGDRQTPQILSPRMSRWVEFLAAYSYQLLYKPGKDIGHADALSRCPLPESIQDPAPTYSVLLIDELRSPITAADIRTMSATDPLFRKVFDWVQRGWPPQPPSKEFLPFFRRQLELSVHQGCLLWGNRVVVPPGLRQQVLAILHDAHPGIVRMKGLGRSYVWWPLLDRDIENWVAACQECQLSRPVAPAAPVREWESPKQPWARVHVDLAGPFHGKNFIIAVDAFSKWVELALLSSTTTEAVVRVLEGWFASHGLPDVLVSDNGPQFTSAPFQLFLARLGVRHAQTAPFNPAANGQAERAVRSAKEALSRFDPSNWHHDICRYLLAQHTTPCTATKHSPAELMMGRRLRTTLDRLHPDYTSDPFRETLPAARSFQIGDAVYVQNYGSPIKWVPGRVIRLTGPYSYRVRLVDGREWRRHINQLRKRADRMIDQGPIITTEPAVNDSLVAPAVPEFQPTDVAPPMDLPEFPAAVTSPKPASESKAGFPTTAPPATPPAAPPALETPPPAALRRSERVRRRPAYLEDYACAIQVERGVESGLADSASTYCCQPCGLVKTRAGKKREIPARALVGPF